MKRWVCTIFAAVSLLVFVAVCALWVKSHFSADVVSFANRPEPLVVTEWFARSNFGILYFARNDHQTNDMHPRPLAWMSHEPYRGFCGPAVQTRSPCFVLGPFSLGGADYATRSHSAFTLPHWFVAGVAAIAPVVWFWGFHRTRRRMGNGLCPACGYDLRATPGRCPECGVVPGGPGI